MNKKQAKKEARKIAAQVIRRELANGLVANMDDLNAADKKRMWDALEEIEWHLRNPGVSVFIHRMNKKD